MTDQEKDLVILEQKVIALHTRLDRVEVETSAQLKVISDDIKEILAFQNRSKGWAAAFILIGTVLGGIVTKVFIQ